MPGITFNLLQRRVRKPKEAPKELPEVPKTKEPHIEVGSTEVRKIVNYAVIRRHLRPLKVSLAFIERVESNIKESLDRARQRCKKNGRRTLLEHDL